MDSVFCVSWVNSETLNCPCVLIYHENFATLHFIVRHPAIISLSWDRNLFESAMSYLQALSLIFLGNSLAIAYMPTRPCSWKICNGYEWRNDWSPSNIPPGDCIALHKNALRTIPIQLITEVSIVLLRFLVSLYHRKGQSVSELSIPYEMTF